MLAVVCLISFVTAGCQFEHGHKAAVEPHYGQLEQACFGYEPTVWRRYARRLRTGRTHDPERGDPGARRGA